MCGIIGLFLKRPGLEPELGAHMAAMLGAMRDRGPDSAGFAVYGREAPGVKLTLRGPAGTDFAALAAALGLDAEARGTHAVLRVPEDHVVAEVHAALARIAPNVAVVGEGRRMELY